VANLEAALRQATQVSASVSTSSTFDHPTIEAVTPVASTPASSLIEEAVHGVDENGRKSLHGSTSLFELPVSSRTSAAAQASVQDQEQSARRASLLNSAWRERAFERLAEIPVIKASCAQMRDKMSDKYTGTVSIASRFAFLLDSATL